MSVDITWRDQAACQGEDPELFFTSAAGHIGAMQNDRARLVCLRCPVREACLNWALKTGEDWGVYGGHTAEERRIIRRRRKREAQAVPA